MSIADKLTAVAENVPKVYEAGQKSMIDESKIIEKTVSGKRMIAIDDVSELPHNVEVSATSASVIKSCGKNLYLPPLNAQTLNGITVTRNADNSYTLNGTASVQTFIHLGGALPVVSGFTYYVSGGTAEHRISWQCRKSGSNVKTVFAYANVELVVPDSTFNELNCVLDVSAGTSMENVVYKPMISLFPDVKYEPYWQNEHVIQNGKVEIPSASPYMTLIADSDIDISVKYRKSYGIQTEYDKFWGVFQQYGTRTDYRNAFYGAWWNDGVFYPKYDIVAKGSTQSIFASSRITNLRKRLEECGVILDTSGATSLMESFAYQPYNEELPIINTTSAPTLTYLVANDAKLRKIEKLILKADGSQTFANTSFQNNRALEDVEFEGVIGDSVNFQWSTSLSVASMKNIIAHLANYAGTDKEGACKVTFPSSCWVALEADSSAPDGGTWEDCVYSLGWNI